MVKARDPIDIGYAADVNTLRSLLASDFVISRAVPAGHLVERAEPKLVRTCSSRLFVA